MSEVVESVRRVSDIIGEITTAGMEQAQGIEQINQAIIQMDNVAQQNAALVEQSADAAESLQDQASSLTEMVSKFIVDRWPVAITRLQINPQLRTIPAPKYLAPPVRSGMRQSLA